MSDDLLRLFTGNLNVVYGGLCRPSGEALACYICNGTRTI